MKKVIIVTIVLVICILMVGCAKTATTVNPTPTLNTIATPASTPTLKPSPTPTSTPTPKASPTPISTPTPTATPEPAPTPGPNSLVVSRDVLMGDGHQAGEIRVTPGDTFTINLATYKGDDRIWGETPEIINNGVVELVSVNKSPANNPAWQTWNFRALEKGSCLIHFTTNKPGLEVKGWTYALSVGVTSSPVSTFPVEYTTVTPNTLVTENTTDMVKLIYTETEHNTSDAHGALEGKFEDVTKYEIDLMSGGWWERVQSTFTGTVNGKSGSFTRTAFAWGMIDARNSYTISKTSWIKTAGTITGGTGELSSLRGITYYEWTATPVEPATDPPKYQYAGTKLGTFWFLE